MRSTAMAPLGAVDGDVGYGVYVTRRVDDQPRRRRQTVRRGCGATQRPRLN